MRVYLYHTGIFHSFQTSATRQGRKAEKSQRGHNEVDCSTAIWLSFDFRLSQNELSF